MVEHKFYDFSHTFPHEVQCRNVIIFDISYRCSNVLWDVNVINCRNTHEKKKRNIRNTERCMMIQNNNNTNNNIFLRYPIKKDCQ